jgi:hypothetical protein
MTTSIRKITTIAKAGSLYALQRGHAKPYDHRLDELTIADCLGMPDGSKCKTFADYMYMCEGYGVRLVEGD